MPTVFYKNHDHLLCLFDEIHQARRCSNSCGSVCDTSVFRCVECDYNVHKLCAEWPKQIRHPFHKIHPITLKNEPYSSSISFRPCYGCHDWNYEWSFRCDACNFNLCGKCAMLVPAISYERHAHLLAFFETIYGDYYCIKCGCPCNTSVFRCVDCNLNLHLDCFPNFLPPVVKNRCHIDPLTLSTRVVDDDGSGQFYCDACETERNPRHAVYYCEECEFIAHVRCVISEVCSNSVFHCFQKGRFNYKFYFLLSTLNEA